MKTKSVRSEIRVDEARSKLAYLILKVVAIAAFAALGVFVLAFLLAEEAATAGAYAAYVLTAGMGAVWGIASDVLKSTGKRARRRMALGERSGRVSRIAKRTKPDMDQRLH